MIKAVSYILSILLFIVGLETSAQTIEINFPELHDKPYILVVHKGNNVDTLSTGILDKNGSIKIKLKASVNIKAMASLRLENSFIDFIINGEDIKLFSPESILNMRNVSFSNSTENKFLLEEYNLQTSIKNKQKALIVPLSIYTYEDEFYHNIKKELHNIENSDSLHYSRLQLSDLYSAKFLSHTYLLNDMLTYKLYSRNEQETIKKKIQKTDIESLYYSSLWGYFIDTWFKIYRDNEKEDTFLSDISVVINRTQSPEIMNDFANALILFCERYNWDRAKFAFAKSIFDSGKLYNPSGAIARATKNFGLQAGQTAPNIRLDNGKDLSLLKQSKYLVIFHETGCGKCEEELLYLRRNHNSFSDKGIEIISISADTDQKIHTYNKDSFPWTHKLCDYKGYDGENFIQYGILGTPSIFLLNDELQIEGRFVHAKDILKI